LSSPVLLAPAASLRAKLKLSLNPIPASTALPSQGDSSLSAAAHLCGSHAQRVRPGLAAAQDPSARLQERNPLSPADPNLRKKSPMSCEAPESSCPRPGILPDTQSLT
ncbi:hypothetical protein P7K49_035669, partial [Saguinus oedipus]